MMQGNKCCANSCDGFKCKDGRVKYMTDYLAILRQDFEAGTLLMDCIIVDVYDWLVKDGYLHEKAHEAFTETAGDYRTQWLQKHGRKLYESIKDPVYNMQQRHEMETAVKLNLAKKMAVYEFVSRMDKILINNQN